MHGRTPPPRRHAPRNGRNSHDQRTRDSAASQGLRGHRARESATGNPGRGGRHRGGARPAGSQGRRAFQWRRASRCGATTRSSASPRRPSRRAQHVHVHNMGMGDFVKDYAFGADAKPTVYVDQPATFQGFRRPDGRVATRNYIGILTSVNCSAHVAGLVADAFKRHPFTGFEPLGDYPNVDGVVALTHKTGCGMAIGRAAAAASPDARRLRRHPNFSHVHRARPRLRGESDRRACW